MPRRGCHYGMKVVHLRRDMSLTVRQREIVELTFQYWLAKFGVQYGSLVADFYRACAEVIASSETRTSKAGLFLAAKLRLTNHNAYHRMACGVSDSLTDFRFVQQ
jgi:hypothetical protein